MRIFPLRRFPLRDSMVRRFLWLSGVGIAGGLVLGMPPVSSRSTEFHDATDHSSYTEDVDPNEADECGLEFNADRVDFGTVFEGTKTSLAVKIRNQSDHMIEIVSASASCGCTSVLTQTPFQMAPGGERDLDIQMNTTNNIGELEKIVTVFVHDGQQRFKYPISVRAHSIPLVTIDRREFNFGMVKGDDRATAEMTVTLNHEPETASARPPVYIAATPDAVRAELSEVAPPDGSARQWKLSVTVDGREIPAESVDGDLVVVTPSTVEGIVRIPVRAKQHSFLKCSPGRICFGVIRDEPDAVEIIRLDCAEGHRYEVHSVEIVNGPPSLAVRYDHARQQVSATVDLDKAESGFFRARINVGYSCDGSSRQILNIPVTGYRLNAQ